MIKLIISIVLYIIIFICGYLYLTRARDYKIQLNNFKTSELYELTFKDTDGNIILRDNGKQAGLARKNTASLFKAENLEFDIGHVKLKEIMIVGKLNNVNIILYRDNENIFEAKNVVHQDLNVPLVYRL
jgi:hypothetical protein